MVKRGRLELGKVWGQVWGPRNVADHLTKGKMAWEFVELLREVGGELRGRIVGSKWMDGGVMEGGCVRDRWD